MLGNQRLVDIESKHIQLVLALKEVQYLSEKKLEILREAAKLSTQIAEMTEKYDTEIKALPKEVKEMFHFITTRMKNGEL